MGRWRITSLRGRLADLLRSIETTASPSARSALLDRHVEQIRAQQIRLLFEQLPSALLATTILGALVVYVLWHHVPHVWLTTWMALLAATTLTRVLLVRKYWRNKPESNETQRWGRRFIIGVLVSGLIWGAAGVFPLAADAMLQQMFVALVLAGLAAGGMSTLSSFRGAYAAFLVPAILPFAFNVLFHGGQVFLAMSAMLVLFIVMMSLISARYYRSLTESLLLRFDNVELLDVLAAARDRQKEINRELAGQMQETQRTEEALRVSN